MKSNVWSRRHFLAASAAAPLVTIQPARPEVIAASEKRMVLLVMDEIIPAGDGMPSASQAGGMAYMERLAVNEPEVAKQFGQSLHILDAFSVRRFEREFSELEAEERISALEEMERDAPQQFGFLRGTVYETYYTQPAIWKLIGYVPYPTDRKGPHLKPFDDSLLANVRNRSKLYREV